MMISAEWQDAPHVRDPVLRATWCRLAITVGDHCLTRVHDEPATSVRQGIYGSSFPLAEWIVENWWCLLHEHALEARIPSGRRCGSQVVTAKRPSIRHRDRWLKRHNLLAARDGGALPDVTIARDGDRIIIAAFPDSSEVRQYGVKFLTETTTAESCAQVEAGLKRFVETVISRIEEQGLLNEEPVKRLIDTWAAISSADHTEFTLCRSLAILGLDPYDPDEATDDVVALVERVNQRFPASLREDFFEGVDGRIDAMDQGFAWVEQAMSLFVDEAPSAVLRDSDRASYRSAYGSWPHDRGYDEARRFRSELGLKDDQPIDDLRALLARTRGWHPDCFQELPDGCAFDGLFGRERKTSRPLLVLPSAPLRESNRRFLLSRALFFDRLELISKSVPQLLTRSPNSLQRAARAFAAEFLAPAAALQHSVSGTVSAEDIDVLANHFNVSSMVIQHQIENHGLACIER